MTVPKISPAEILDYARLLFPSATVAHIPVNAEHQSWRIEIEGERLSLELFWGPLSGFGGTDRLAYNPDADPFALYDVNFDSAGTAKSWLHAKAQA